MSVQMKTNQTNAKSTSDEMEAMRRRLQSLRDRERSYLNNQGKNKYQSRSGGFFSFRNPPMY